MFSWFKSWKERRALKALMRQMGSSLRERYGQQEYYTPEQVLKTADLQKEEQIYAVAMYVLPENAQGILRKLDKSKIAEHVRAYMIARCFGFSGGCDPSYNVFMHHDAISSHHAGMIDGSHGHHVSNDGHSHGGDSGGGHH